METFLNNLKLQAEQNPVAALMVGAAVITAMSKFIDASGAAIGRKAYAQMVANSAKRLP